MAEYLDHEGRRVRLTEERLAHILEHPEMQGLEQAIGQVLAQPHRVIISLSDPDARLYYRPCDTVKKGSQSWPRS